MVTKTHTHTHTHTHIYIYIYFYVICTSWYVLFYEFDSFPVVILKRFPLVKLEVT